MVRKSILAPEYELASVNISIPNTIYWVQIAYSLCFQAIKCDKQALQKFNTIVDVIIGVLLCDFILHLDWETRKTPAKNKPLLKFLNQKLKKKVSKVFRGQYILNLIFTTEDDIVRDINVCENSESNSS